MPRVTSLHDIPQHRKKVVGIGHYYPHPDINDPARELRGRFKQSSKGQQALQQGYRENLLWPNGCQPILP